MLDKQLYENIFKRKDYLYPKDGYDLTIDTSILSEEECGMKVYSYVIKAHQR